MRTASLYATWIVLAGLSLAAIALCLTTSMLYLPDFFWIAMPIAALVLLGLNVIDGSKAIVTRKSISLAIALGVLCWFRWIPVVLYVPGTSGPRSSFLVFLSVVLLYFLVPAASSLAFRAAVKGILKLRTPPDGP